MSVLLTDRLSFLSARPFAHRGLHGRGLSENGIAAFDAAIAEGFGIECDVRLSADGTAMVFHDATLARMAGRADAISECAAVDLDTVLLPDGTPVPRLAYLLDQCGFTTPLLVEIKVDGREVAPLCAAVVADLARYPGAPAATMSFNPMAVRWFARYAPHVARGLVVTQQGNGKWRGWLARTLAFWLWKPDFIACDIRDLPSPFAARARRRRLPVLTWTVRTGAQRMAATAHADQIIFERIDE